MVCDAGKVSRPRVGRSAHSEIAGASALDLEKVRGLKKYMDALRPLPASGPQRAKLIALRAQLERTLKDHNLPTQPTKGIQGVQGTGYRVQTQPRKGSQGNAMERIGHWLQTSETDDEASPHGVQGTGYRVQTSETDDEASPHGADVAGSLTRLLEQEIQGAMLAATASAYPCLSASVQTALPNELCASEPTDVSLEGRMDRILQCVIKYNGRSFLSEGYDEYTPPQQPSFNALGFSVHLCRHMASERSDARLLEKWWITIVDRRVKRPARRLVLNEWLGNQLLHAGRMRSALDPTLSTTQDTLQEFEVLAEKGLAVLYDRIFMSAFTFPHVPHAASGSLTVAALVLTCSSGKIGDMTADYDLRFCCTDDMAALAQLHLHAEDMRVLTSHLHRVRRASKAAKVTVAAADPSIGGSAVHEHFVRLVGNGSGLPLSKLGDAMLQLERKLDGPQLRRLIRRGVKDARTGRVLNWTEFKSLLLLDIELRREALFLRLLARCPEGVRAVLAVPPLYTTANDSEATARQEWYAQLCYDLVWACVDLNHGELQLGDWREIRALAAGASTLTVPAVRVHVCANDAISHRSEAGSPIRKCCCWLTFENAAGPMVVPGVIYGSHDERAPSEHGMPTPTVEQHNLPGGGGVSRKQQIPRTAFPHAVHLPPPAMTEGDAGSSTTNAARAAAEKLRKETATALRRVDSEVEASPDEKLRRDGRLSRSSPGQKETGRQDRSVAGSSRSGPPSSRSSVEYV